MSKLAVKYRPTTFEDVIGQELNVKILKKQVENNDLPTGYLFSGGSGIGKTTIARIIANKIDAEVIEIDGASNNSVSNIREIRKNTRLKSITNDYKVYIIDESHMLSSSAFNALLKTLEEPPDNVMFILATTEPEKILNTIHTRLQKFEFTRVNWQKIEERLKYIVEQEKREMKEEVIQYISKISNGSVRSAISILEKVMELDNPDIEDVSNLIGGINYPLVFDLFRAVLKDKDITKVLELIEKSHEKGKNLHRLIKQTAEFTVELTKYAMFNNFNYIKVPQIYKEELNEMVEIVSNSDFRLRELFNEFNQLSNDLKYEEDRKLLVQGTLMQMVGD